MFVGFLETLQDQDDGLRGRYALCLGVRDMAELPHRARLLRLAHQKGCEVRQAMSQASAEDVAEAHSMGFSVFVGRADTYLKSHASPEATRTYVCGSAGFGRAVAFVLDTPAPSGKSRLRVGELPAQPRVFYDLFSGAASQGDEAQVALPAMDEAEIAEHHHVDDCYVTYKDMVYDITPFVRSHPGGHKMLMSRAGLAVDGIFDHVHGASHEVISTMRDCLVARIAVQETTEQGQQNEPLQHELRIIGNDLRNESSFYVDPTRIQHTSVSRHAVMPVAALLVTIEKCIVRMTASLSESAPAPLRTRIRCKTKALFEAIRAQARRQKVQSSLDVQTSCVVSFVFEEISYFERQVGAEIQRAHQALGDKDVDRDAAVGIGLALLVHVETVLDAMRVRATQQQEAKNA